MNEFQALITSIGENTVHHLGRPNLVALNVFGDPVDQSAAIEIALSDNSWASQERAIDRMILVRDMYIDEISLSYRFVELDSDSEQATAAAQPAFCMA